MEADQLFNIIFLFNRCENKGSGRWNNLSTLHGNFSKVINMKWDKKIWTEIKEIIWTRDIKTKSTSHELERKQETE